MKHRALLGFMLLIGFVLAVPLTPALADDDTVSRLTAEEVTYFAKLDRAYAAANGIVSELESVMVSWAAPGTSPVEITTDLAGYHGKLSALAPTFRTAPPKSMSGLSGVNSAVAQTLESAFSPCLGLVAEEAGSKIADWAGSFLGTKPAKKTGPSIQSKMLGCLGGRHALLKDVLASGQNALYTRIHQIEEERFEKELGAAVLEEELFGDGDWCFIATAAYGTASAEEIDILRQFRDECLLSSRIGTAFVDLYYAASPPAARFIYEHEALRTAVRTTIVDPVVALVDLSRRWWAR